jgi:signal transduction histidine kinase
MNTATNRISIMEAWKNTSLTNCFIAGDSMLARISGYVSRNDVLYTLAVCTFIVMIYLAVGYYYRKTFYRELIELMDSRQEDIIAALPAPQNCEQELYLELIRKLDDQHTAQLQQLHNEKRDHQDFIMSWIHEVKLPIAASRLLMENRMERSADYLIDKLEDEVNKIDNDVEQALYYSRIDSFSKDYFITEIQLNQVVKESVKKYAKMFINKQIRFTMDNTAIFVQSDSKWLSFIIDQIMANSLKYTSNGGEITVKFEEDNREKRLLIQDTGMGIKLEDLQRVFDKGFTGFAGRSHAKSTGMGLYLAEQLAIKLGHELSIQSEEGKFTTVIVHYPKIRNYYRL